MKKVEFERKMFQDSIRRVSYFTKRENSIEFERPKEYYGNIMFGNDRPFKDHKPQNVFYIPKEEYQSIVKLFQDFDLKEELWPDLTWAYLNMCFAKGNAVWNDNFDKEYNLKLMECYKLLDLLEEIKSGKKRVVEFTFVTKEIIDKKSFGRSVNKRFKGHIASQFLESVLVKYKEIQSYEVLNMTYELFKIHGDSDMRRGYKNHEKMSQSYYCSVIFNYLRPKLLVHSHFKNDKEFLKIFGNYSQNKLFLFVGKFIQLSGLLQTKDDTTDIELTDLIKKKLAKKKSKKEGLLPGKNVP